MFEYVNEQVVLPTHESHRPHQVYRRPLAFSQSRLSIRGNFVGKGSVAGLSFHTTTRQ